MRYETSSSQKRGSVRLPLLGPLHSDLRPAGTDTSPPPQAKHILKWHQVRPFRTSAGPIGPEWCDDAEDAENVPRAVRKLQGDEPKHEGGTATRDAERLFHATTGGGGGKPGGSKTITAARLIPTGCTSSRLFGGRCVCVWSPLWEVRRWWGGWSWGCGVGGGQFKRLRALHSSELCVGVTLGK